MKMHAIFKAFFLLLFILLVSCAVNPVTGKQEIMFVSERQEIELGNRSAPSMKWEFGGRYHDPELESYLHAIVKRIWQNSERPQLPLHFYIQNTSIPNAFALPGHVAITRGLLDALENEAQFAAIMGHEAGHVMARHTAQRLSRITMQQIGLAVGGAVLEGTEGADTLLTLGAAGSQLFLLKYDRAQELEADRLGVKYMSNLGYDPFEALKAHELLENSVEDYMKRLGKKRQDDNLLSGLLSTHPRKDVRLDEINDMIDSLPPYTIKGNGKFDKMFQNKLTRLREINNIYHLYDEADSFYQKKDYASAESRLNRAISLNDKQPPFFNLLGFIKIQKKLYPEAQHMFNRALSLEADYQPSLYGLGAVQFLKGDYKKAIPLLKKSLQLYPGHAASHFALGKSYFSLRNFSDAIPYLDTISQVAPNHPEVHGLLGICFEKTGDLYKAVREYRYQLQVAPETELGLHARKRLKVLEPLVKN
jgi:predicted Zn-dependent protease